MPSQEELFAEWGRPEAYPPPKALNMLKWGGVRLADDVRPDDAQAFRYFGRDMADAFTNNGRSEPGRRFLGMVQDPDDVNYWIAAYQITDKAETALLEAQQLTEQVFREQ